MKKHRYLLSAASYVLGGLSLLGCGGQTNTQESRQPQKQEFTSLEELARITNNRYNGYDSDAEFADIDGDGDLDLLLIFSQKNRIHTRVYENKIPR